MTDDMKELQRLGQEYDAANGAIAQLTEHQQQLDMDGLMVGVSRQALDEVLAYLATRTDLYTAAIAERDAPSGWRNISTAPKDGTRVLITCMKASRATKSRQGQMAVDFWHTIKDNGYDGWGLFNASYFPATHWMPLPAAPHPRDTPEGRELLGQCLR